MDEIEKDRLETEDSYVSLARLTLENYVNNGKAIDLPQGLPAEMLNKRAGVFVSLKINGDLRGCIGTVLPTTDSIAEEIIQNAISAGVRDSRFHPVVVSELPEIIYSVDVLAEAERISSLKELEVSKYGVIVSAGRRAGLLLPDLEGVDTPEQQVLIALRKAGISPKESFSLERFEIIRHGVK